MHRSYIQKPLLYKIANLNYFFNFASKFFNFIWEMAKTGYRFNPETLSYDKIHISFKKKVLRLVIKFIQTLSLSLIIFFVAVTFIDSPKEKVLKREKEEILAQYHILNDQINQHGFKMRMVASLLINLFITLFHHLRLGSIPEQKCISNAHHKWFWWSLQDDPAALVIKFLLVHGLFAEFSRHFISIIKLIMSNNCKSRESIECAIGETYDDDGN